MGFTYKQMIMERITLTALRIFLVAGFFFTAANAYAASDTNSALCGGDALAQLFCDPNISTMLNTLFTLSITLGGILAMLRIGYAGFLYMGREDMWSNKTRAKEVFRDSIIGLLVLLAIWLILHQINPCILKISLLQSGTGSTCDPTTAT